MAAYANDQQLREAAKRSPEPVSDEELRYRALKYTTQLRNFETYAPELHPAALADELRRTVEYAEIDRVLYEAAREAHASERARQLSASNLLLAQQQLALGDRLAEALEEIKRNAARQATLVHREASELWREGEGETPMNEMAKKVQARDADRLRVLQAVYEMVAANTHAMVPMAEVYEKAGLDQERGRAASDYLQAERLLMGKPGHHLSITHAGVNEAEHTVRKPTEATDHFTSLVVNQVFNGAVGAVQNGAGAVANVQQQNNVASPDQREAMLAELDTAAESAEDPEKRDQALELAKALREEMQKPAPSATRVAAYVTLMSALVSAAPTVEHVVKMLFR